MTAPNMVTQCSLTFWALNFTLCRRRLGRVRMAPRPGSTTHLIPYTMPLSIILWPILEDDLKHSMNWPADIIQLQPWVFALHVNAWFQKTCWWQVGKKSHLRNNMVNHKWVLLQLRSVVKLEPYFLGHPSLDFALIRIKRLDSRNDDHIIPLTLIHSNSSGDHPHSSTSFFSKLYAFDGSPDGFLYFGSSRGLEGPACGTIACGFDGPALGVIACGFRVGACGFGPALGLATCGFVEGPAGHAVDFSQIAMLISRGPDCKINADCQSSHFGQLGKPLANPQMVGLGTGSASTRIPALPLLAWVPKNIYRPIKYYLIFWYCFRAHPWLLLAGFIHARLDLLTVGM